MGILRNLKTVNKKIARASLWEKILSLIFLPIGVLGSTVHVKLSPLQVNNKLAIIVIFPLRGLLLCFSFCDMYRP